MRHAAIDGQTRNSQTTPCVCLEAVSPNFGACLFRTFGDGFGFADRGANKGSFCALFTIVTQGCILHSVCRSESIAHRSVRTGLPTATHAHTRAGMRMNPARGAGISASRGPSHPISSHTTLLYAEHAHHLQPPPHSYACVHAPQTRTAHGTPLARPSTPRLARCDTHDGREAHTRLCHPLLANMAPRSTSHCFGCASAHAEQVHVPGNAACEAPPASGRLRRRSDTSLGFHCGHAPAALPHLPSA